MTGILVIIVIIVFAFLKDKLTNTMSSGINRKLLYRSEYDEGKRIISQKITFQTSSSKSEIIDALKTYVKISEGTWTMKFKLYQKNLNENSISYAFGNIVNPQSFLVTLYFPNKDFPEWYCEVSNWTLVNGIHSSIQEIKELLDQIEKALLSVWAKIEKTENPETNDSTDQDTWIDPSETQEKFRIPTNSIKIGWIIITIFIIVFIYNKIF